MGEYHQQPFSQRVKTLGDAAEAIFLEVSPLGMSQRFGWRRPSVSMASMSAFIRHAPDYYAGVGQLVEVMGCGRDGIVKLKLEKYDSLLAWNKHQPLALFVSNSHLDEWVLVPTADLKRAVNAARRRGDIDAFENDGNEYYKLPFVDLVELKGSISGKVE